MDDRITAAIFFFFLMLMAAVLLIGLGAGAIAQLGP